MSNSILNVAMNGLLVGEWRKLTSGATEFQYAEKWLESVRSRPISLSLPLSHKIYRGDSVYNFFDNLLPDNEQIRSRIQQRFQPQQNPHLIYFRRLDRIVSAQFSFIRARTARYAKFMQNH